MFISSNEDEFSDLRGELKDVLEKVQVFNSKRLEETVDKSFAPKYSHHLIVPEVVEYSRGSDVERKINIAMKKSQLYVGIFGLEYSNTTVKEFDQALDRGMTTLIYFFTEPPAPLKSKSLTKSQSEFYDFLIDEVHPKTLIRGNYKRVEIKTRQELEDEIVDDILAELTVMIRQYHGVQKAVSGFET